MKKAISLVLVLVLGLVSLSQAAEDTWTPKADMPSPRVLLSTSAVDGRIYAIGGQVSGEGVSAMEVYDPVTDSWTPKFPMPTARWGLAACAVNGRIYAIGGAKAHPGSAYAIVEEYDPATDTWTTKTPMPTARSILSTRVVNGKIYAMGGMLSEGGVGFGSQIVEEYDPATDTWTSKAPMSTGRYAFGTVTLDGKIYAMGGVTSFPQSTSTVEEYDPATDTWTAKGSMPAAKTYFSASEANGKIYAIGGSPHPNQATPMVYEYGPATDTWTSKADMLSVRTALSTSVVNGKIYAIGGSTEDYPWSALATVEEYDPGFPPPDFNGDYRIDIEDLILFIEHWGQDDPLYDIAPLPLGDGVVDAADLERLMDCWGHVLDDPSLLALWKLDETEGDVAYDSAAENDVDVMGDALWQPEGGRVEGALQLDGIDDYIRTPFMLNPADEVFSVFAWIKDGAPGQVIMSQTNSVNWLSVDSQNGALMTELIGPRGHGSDTLVSATDITDGNWHRLGLVWDGSDRILYVDNVEVARGSQRGLTAADGGFNIGAGQNIESGSFWSGLIDDVRIYDRVVVP
jgi:N-acetylneuraminic acid mutarotase